MTDKREQILQRLLFILGSIEGMKTAVRNIEPPEPDRPAAAIFDADEEIADFEFDERRQGAPIIMIMRPEIYVLVAAAPESLGTDINTKRAALIKAIMYDAELLALTKDDRGIRYEGCASALSRGRQLNGEIGLSFAFTYVLDPAAL